MRAMCKAEAITEKSLPSHNNFLAFKICSSWSSCFTGNGLIHVTINHTTMWLTILDFMGDFRDLKLSFPSSTFHWLAFGCLLLPQNKKVVLFPT